MDAETCYRRKRWLQNWGWDTDTGAVHLHNSSETAKHLIVKALLAWAIQRRGRPWATEVRVGDRGVADVLDWGPKDGRAVVYEVETNPTPERVERKVEQFVGGPVRDVLVVPVDEAPGELATLVEWTEKFVVG